MIFNFKEPSEFKILCNLALSMWNMDKGDILGRNREEDLACARAILMVLARTELRMTFSRAGRAFNRDPGTIIHHCKNHDDRMHVTIVNKKKRYVDKDYFHNFTAMRDELIKFNEQMRLKL